MMARSGTSQSAAPAKAASEAPADFTNLINALLAPSNESQENAQAAPPDLSSSQDGTVLSMPSTPPATLLAESLIRSMFTSAGPGSAGGAASISDSTTKKTAARSAAEPAQAVVDPSTGVATVVPPALNALTQSPVMQSADTSRGSAGAPIKGNLPGLPNGAVFKAAVSKATSSAPLAFALRLTPSQPPVSTQETSVPVAQTPEIADAAPATPKPATEPNSQPLPAESAAPSSESSAQAQEAEPEPKQSTESSESKPRQEEVVREPSPAAPIAAVASATVSSGGMSENAGGFLNSQANPASPQTGAKVQAVTESPAPSAAEALRAAAPTAPAASAQTGAPVREIAVRIASPQAPAVDVHLVERSGQINVAVRTPDGSLQTSLRQDLGSLVNSLERAGYRAEAFAPREGVQQAGISAQTNSQNSRQQSESGSGGRGSAFDDSQQGGQQQQRQRDPRAAKWIEELENQQ